MLWFISQASDGIKDEFGVAQKSTPDQIADDILRQAIREQHPQLLADQKDIEIQEKKLITTLRAEMAQQNNTKKGQM